MHELRAPGRHRVDQARLDTRIEGGSQRLGRKQLAELSELERAAAHGAEVDKPSSRRREPSERTPHRSTYAVRRVATERGRSAAGEREEGISAGRRDHGRCALRVERGGGTRHETCDQSGVERAEVEACADGTATLERVEREVEMRAGWALAARYDEQHAQLGDAPPQVGEQRERPRVSPVEILEHDHDRGRTGAPGGELNDGLEEPRALDIG